MRLWCWFCEGFKVIGCQSGWQGDRVGGWEGGRIERESNVVVVVVLCGFQSDRVSWFQGDRETE